MRIRQVDYDIEFSAECNLDIFKIGKLSERFPRCSSLVQGEDEVSIRIPIEFVLSKILN